MGFSLARKVDQLFQNVTTAVTLGLHDLNASMSIKRHNIGHLDGWQFVKDVVVLAEHINRYQKPLYYWSISLIR
jgi:hypothetical protein